MSDPNTNPPEPSVVARIESVLRRHPEVLFAYVFGSVAKGTARPDSDIDVAVYLASSAEDEPGGSSLEITERGLDLEAELESEFGRRVQIVPLNTAPVALRQNVLATGNHLFSRDDRARNSFYVRHARRYYDMENARRIFDRYRNRRIEEGTFGGGTGDG